MSGVHSPSAHTQPGKSDGGVNWSEIGPRAVEALSDFIVWVERFKGPMTEAQSDSLFDTYGKARRVTYAVDPVADKARMATYRKATPAASASQPGTQADRPKYQNPQPNSRRQADD